MKKQMLFDMEGSREVTSLPRTGKDEMNFAEHPIALLTDRVPKGQKSIKYEDEVYCDKRRRLVPRRRIIEGSEEYGLPTATDDLVILALIQLTKLKGDFKRPEVEFTRLELIKMLGWADEGRSYDRIKLSLLRIKGVNYFYDNAWWDPRLKQWTTKAFSIIDNVEINDSRVSNGQGGLFPSRIKWNEVVFDSFQAGFLRDIDFPLCMQLQHPTALRIYRFLGKRFYVRPVWEFDLKEFAHLHVGIGRTYEGGTQIARKLQPAITELENVGFLEPLAASERFLKKGRAWTIRFVQPPPAPALPPATPTLPAAPAPLVEALAERGVTKKTAAELVQRHPADLIERQIEAFDWLVDKKDRRVAKSPAGYLVESIRTPDGGYKTPKGFVSKAERQRQAEAATQRQQAEAEKRRGERQQQARERKADAHIKQLDPAERARMEAQALASASPEERQSYDSPTMAPFRDTLRIMMLRRYVLEHIVPREGGPADA